MTSDPAVGIDQGPGGVSEVEQMQRWKLEYDGPPGDRYARHVEDPNGGWVAWPHVEKLLALVADLRQQQEQAIKELHDNGGVELRSGLAASIRMTLRSMNATREALIARAVAAEASLTALREQMAEQSAKFSECASIWCPYEKRMHEAEAKLKAAEATGAAAVSQLQKENEELKARLARVDGERRAAGPTGSTASTD